MHLSLHVCYNHSSKPNMQYQIYGFIGDDNVQTSGKFSVRVPNDVWWSLITPYLDHYPVFVIVSILLLTPSRGWSFTDFPPSPFFKKCMICLTIGRKLISVTQWNVTPLIGDFGGRVGIYKFLQSPHLLNMLCELSLLINKKKGIEEQFP